MAQISKNKLLEVSESIESIYSDLINELLIMLSEYLGEDIDSYTLAVKFSKIGVITENTVKKVLSASKRSEKEIEKIFNDISNLALEDVEEEYQNAAKDGKVKDVVPLAESILVSTVINNYINETKNKIISTNNTIVNNTVENYFTAVNDVINKVEIERNNRLWYNDNEQFVEVVENIVSNREITSKALSTAIQNLSDYGITGFVDKAGRQWQADTYTTMVVRTNAHDLAIDSIKARQEEYGSDLFQVSSHPGARPLCYPYQNKILSWGSSGGVFYDGAGVRWEYDSIDNTSYGEPAGLFGINCGHYPLPVIPDVSIIHDQPVQNKEENDREYQESQKQRYYERQIRTAKRDYEMQKVSGADNTTLKYYKERVNNAQENMRNFISETGRTRRYDREKVIINDEATINNFYSNITLNDYSKLDRIANLKLNDSDYNGNYYQKFVYSTKNGAGLPQKVDEYSLKDIEVFRGVRDTVSKSAEQINYETINSKIPYIGNGVRGDGIYFSNMYQTAESRYGGNVLSVAIDENANMVDFIEIYDEFLKSEYRKNVQNADLSTYARLSGYDVIVSNGVKSDELYYNVINREVLKYKE